MKERITPKDNWDVFIDYNEYPLLKYDIWGKEKESRIRRFYGSGNAWHEIIKDAWGGDKEERVGGWMSSTLHDMWWNWYKENGVKEG